MNWCWWEWWFFKPPYAIFFDTSCNKHDDKYDELWDWFDRLIADLYLLKFMIQDSFRVSCYKIPYFVTWSILYFIWVRLWGWRFFNYKWSYIKNIIWELFINILILLIIF